MKSLNKPFVQNCHSSFLFHKAMKEKEDLMKKDFPNMTECSTEWRENWKILLVISQEEKTLTDSLGNVFQRIPSTLKCGDCSTVSNKLHVCGCDNEKCPKCYGQLISCGCFPL